MDEPTVDPGSLHDLVDTRPSPHHLVQREEALGSRHFATVPQHLEVEIKELRVAAEREAEAALLE